MKIQAQPSPTSSAASSAPPRKGPLWLPYALAVALIAALVITLASMASWQEKQRYRERATVATENIALLLDRHISDTFDKIDVVLQSCALHYQQQLANGSIDAPRLNHHLLQHKALLPELDSLRILDRNGVVRYGDGLPSSGQTNLSDRNYFIRARDHADAGAIVDGPLMARISQKWVLIFARRLNAPDGSFAGVVYANLATSHFDKVFSAVELGPRGAATLRAQDMTLVHRAPLSRAMLGSREVSAELQSRIRAQPESGHYMAVVALDGIERSNAYRRLQRYPFYIIVGLATDDYLGGWKQNALTVSGIALLAILTTALAAFFMYRAHRRLSTDIAERIRIAEKLEAAMAERSRLNDELRLRAQEAEAANRAKTTFLANMSHELRTPMNAIMGMTQLLQRRLSDPGQLDMLGKLAHAARHLLAIIDDLLDLSRIEAGKMQLETVSFLLADLFEHQRELHRAKAMEKGLQLLIELPPDSSALRLQGDPTRLGQILSNLIGNAVKFTEHGSVTVRVAAPERVERRVRLRCTVTDTGIGIAATDQPRLFADFEQADGSMTRKYGGTGLGLAISKRLVHMMGGQIGVDSVPGQGSTFWFTVLLDAAPGTQTDDSDTSPAEMLLKTSHAGARILLVEDEPINREVARGLLDELGLRVDSAEDGAQALALAERNSYALILMDMQMPVLNGIEATRAIRALPGYARIPIVAMTANAFEEDRQNCLAAGMNDHLGKPVVPARLYQCLLHWLDRAGELA